ncbi:hypothetical protein C8J57DRAFT_1246666 [Mycena rebaudengoi]|nr:hypothetical protein C8J57DRAFT_1246666 [Mycena rebaudengoi]
MPFSRTREDSDVDYAPPASKRRKKAPPIITERAVSMPPSSPGPPVHTHDSPEPVTPEAEPLLPLPPLPALFPDPYGSPLRASTTNFPQTPHRGQSIEPPASSPMSVMNLTPVKPKPVKRRPGRPQHSPETHILHSTLRHLRGSGQSTPAQQEEFRRASETLQRKRAASAERRTAALKKRGRGESGGRKVALHAQKTRDAQQVLADVTASTEDGGYNFKDLDEFFSAIFRTGGDYQASANLTRYVHSHGAQHAKAMFARSAPARDEYIDGELAEIFQKEGRAIQDILTRNSTTTVTDLLKQFSMDKLAAQIQEAAPKLWMALVVVTMPDESTRREISGEPRRNKGLVPRATNSRKIYLGSVFFFQGLGDPPLHVPSNSLIGIVQNIFFSAALDFSCAG